MLIKQQKQMNINSSWFNGLLYFTCCVILLGFFGCLLIFSGIIVSKNSLRNTMSVSNSLDPDQAQHLVGLDLNPNNLQTLWLSSDHT